MTTPHPPLKQRRGTRNVTKTSPAVNNTPIIENSYRKKIAPLHEAAYLTEMVSRYGSQHQVARRIGKTQAYVAQRLSLLRLIPEFQQLLASKEIGIKDARQLAVLDADAQRKVWQADWVKPCEKPDKLIIELEVANRSIKEVAENLRETLLYLYTDEEFDEFVRYLKG